MRSLPSMLLAIVAAGATRLPAQEPGEPPRVFIRAGEKTHNPVDNGEHDYPAFLGQWSNLLAGRGARVDGALHFPTAGELAETDVLVLYTGDGGSCSRAERAVLEPYLARGGGLVVLHDGMCSDDPDWFAGLAGGAKKHGEMNWSRGALALRVVDRAHPVSAGMSDFEMDDEAFYRLRTAAGMNVLLESPLPDGDAAGEVRPQAWSYERALAEGRTARAFVWMQGHYTAKLLEDGPRDFILRGIAWAAGRPSDALLGVAPPSGAASR